MVVRTVPTFVLRRTTPPSPKGVLSVLPMQFKLETSMPAASKIVRLGYSTIPSLPAIALSQWRATQVRLPTLDILLAKGRKVAKVVFS